MQFKLFGTLLIFVLILIATSPAVAQYNGPESVEYDPVGDRYFVSNTSSSIIKVIDQQGNVADYFNAGPLNGTLLANILSLEWTENQLNVLASVNHWDRTDLSLIPPAEQEETPDESAGVFIFRQKASLFGHNAPVWGSLPLIMRFPQPTGATPAATTPPYPTTWEGRTLEDEQASDPTIRTIDLDRNYDQVVGGWVYLKSGAEELAIPIEKAEEINRSDFTLSGKSTRLHVETGGLEAFTLRDAGSLPSDRPTSRDRSVAADFGHAVSPRQPLP